MRKIQLVSEDDLERELLDHLRNSRLPDYFLYTGRNLTNGRLEPDEADQLTNGKELFSLLESNLDGLSPFIKHNLNLISIGVGGGERERKLLERFNEKIGHFFPVDVSSSVINLVLERTRQFHFDVTGIVGFFEDLKVLSTFWTTPALFCFLGNNFCNFEADFALELFRDNLQDDDLLLLDAHLFNGNDGVEDGALIEKSYRSTENAAFNFGPFLSHGISAECLEFRLDLVLTGTPVGMAYRTRKGILVLKDCLFEGDAGTLNFNKGERIELGFIYKYTESQMRDLLSMKGFSIVREWTDGQRKNILILAKKENGFS